MAHYPDRYPNNATGRFYVDSSCIDCDQCRHHAPEFFVREDREAHSFVVRQPVTSDEIALCEEAVSGCPTESIGNDGDGDSGTDIGHHDHARVGTARM
jgi:ferredoxin